MFITSLGVLENSQQRNDLSDFFVKYKNRFFLIAQSKLHNCDDAEDAVMEMLAMIADKPNNFFAVAPEQRVAYATVIVKNIANKMIRTKLEKPIESLDEHGDDLAADVTIEEVFLSNERARELTEYIRKMPEALKDALLLKVLHGRSTAQTASDLSISVSAARKRLYRAKELIKDFMEENNHDKFNGCT